MVEFALSQTDVQFVTVPILDMGANSVNSPFVDLVSVSMEVDVLFRIISRFVIVVIRAT